MKKSFLVIAVLFSAAFALPSGVNGQSPLEREIEQLGLKGVSFTIAQPQQATPQPAASKSGPTFAVDETHHEVDIVPNLERDSTTMIFGHVTNLTNSDLDLGFVRVQNLPKYWKTSVCFGINCFADWVSAAMAQEPWKPNEVRELVLHVLTPPGAQGVGNIELTLYSLTGDTVKLTYVARTLDVPVDTCRTFLVDNPYNGEVTLKNLSIADPELFDFEVVSDLSYPTPAGKAFYVRICSKVYDGQDHSSRLIFETDSGTFEHNFTLRAITAGVKPTADNASGTRIVSVSPNPASASQFLKVHLESSNAAAVSLSIVDLLGREMRSQEGYISVGNSTQSLAVHDLGPGSYIVLVKKDGVVMDQASFNVTR